MQNITITQNDKGYLISIPITNSAGAVKDLTGYTVTLKAWKPETPTVFVFNAACTVSVPSNGIATYLLLASDTASGARYLAKCEMTQTDVIESTAEFSIVIPSADLYCTLSEVKAELEILTEDKDDYLYGMIESVKGLIDSYCGRSFNTVAETRYFDGTGDVLFIDDLVSIAGVDDGIWLDTGVRTYANAMTATDYDLYPLNKTPKTRVELTPASHYCEFANGIKKGVKIVATWGFQTTVPVDVRRAAIMWVTILETQRKAGYSNVVGSAETGQITIDRDPPSQVKKILDGGHFVKKRFF